MRATDKRCVILGTIAACLLVECLLVLGYACSTAPAPPPAVGLSPAMIQSDEQPWAWAQKVAQLVPNSTTVIGHGDSMLPLYPSGTVLILQKLSWEHLEPGMTVVYCSDPYNPFALVCHVITERRSKDEWTVRGLNNDEADHVSLRRVNYIGTVVAAVRRSENASILVLPASLRQTTNATCLTGCHIQGETHPRQMPTAGLTVLFAAPP